MRCCLCLLTGSFTNLYATGQGVYFSFPVMYVGAIEMPVSISAYPQDAQTDISREAIARCCDEAMQRPRAHRQLSDHASRYRYGRVQSAMVPVKLSMSATGIVIAPEQEDIDAVSSRQKFCKCHTVAPEISCLSHMCPRVILLPIY